MVYSEVDSSWNVTAHGDAREEKWRGNWRMEWLVSTLHTTSEHGVSSITTADVHTSAASSRLNWRPRRFKWNRLFCRKTKSGFCACAITFQLASTILVSRPVDLLERPTVSRVSQSASNICYTWIFVTWNLILWGRIQLYTQTNKWWILYIFPLLRCYSVDW